MTHVDIMVLGRQARVLGMVTYEKDQDFLLVYDGQHFSTCVCSSSDLFFQTLVVTYHTTLTDVVEYRPEKSPLLLKRRPKRGLQKYSERILQMGTSRDPFSEFSSESLGVSQSIPHNL